MIICVYVDGNNTDVQTIQYAIAPILPNRNLFLVPAITYLQRVMQLINHLLERKNHTTETA